MKCNNAKKERLCAWCEAPFIQRNSLQKVCRPFPCAVEYGKAKNLKKAQKLSEKSKLEFKRETNRKKRALKANDRKHQIKITQPVFNALVRLLDRYQPCISCNRDVVDGDIGGSWDCGHFKTVGGFPELRFVFLNAYRQCKNCNGGAGNYTRKNKTVDADYRMLLADRMGQDVVDWLDGPHEMPHYSCEELIEMRALWRKEIRYIEKNNKPSRNWRDISVIGSKTQLEAQ